MLNAKNAIENIQFVALGSFGRRVKDPSVVT